MTFKKINDALCKDSIVATFIDFSDAGPITRCMFKTSGLDGSEYFTSLEMARKSKYQMTLVTTNNCLMNFLNLTSISVNLRIQWILQFH
ncbi:hypothetical protein R3W88_007789 [Solanum pinnatisectum]|uniref:Uncharacterized protein n=1 Tax=Solanum pinnatisectum TaxID=50273 RepID=A0AAV9M6T9_9SOLN|nr:hypothetical protein R3W88_007789 [Solanum pinnatisectum]